MKSGREPTFLTNFLNAAEKAKDFSALKKKIDEKKLEENDQMIFTDLLNAFGNEKDSLALKKKIDDIRNHICTYDKSLLENKSIRIDFENLSNSPNGRFSVCYKGIDFDCLFKRNNASDKLFVVFSGYRKAGQSEPTFKRWSYYKYLDGNMLNIDDPMCKLHSDLVLGWYYGTENENYLDYIVDLIEHFAFQNQFKQIIFLASSGGGYAALYCGCKIKKSTVIAINPQIKLNLYEYATKFTNITGLDLSVRDTFNRNYLPEMIKEAKETNFLLVENSASDVDMIQFNDLCKVLDTNYHYGLTQLQPNILSWVYEGNSDRPHNAQEYFAILFAVIFLAEHFDNAIEYSEIYLIFSELWKDHYDLIRNNQTAIPQNTRQVECFSSAPNPIREAIVFKTAFSKMNVEISARDSPYNCFVICNKLEPNSIYKLVISNVSVLSGKADNFSVVVKDELTKTVDFIKNFKIDHSATLFITTSQNTDKKELRIYSGEVGKTNNIALQIGFCQLCKIEFVCEGE